MHYMLRSLSGDEIFETLATHVFARAYRAAWRARHDDEPVGPHIIAGLDLVIDFMEQTSNWRH
jgi:hypothetical protein